MAPIFKPFNKPLQKSLILTYKTQKFIYTKVLNLQKSVSHYDNKTEREKVIRKKFIEFMNTYEELTGLKEVRLYQDRVIDAQDKLQVIQDQRRILNEDLNRISAKRNELQAKFHTLSRDDPEWYATIGEENRLLLEERKIRGDLMNVERDERDFFTYMSNAVRDSHEKQRWQSDRTKYWSLILTVISSFLTYLVSDWRHKRIVQQLVENNSQTHPENTELKKLVTTINEATVNLKKVAVTNNVTHEALHNLGNVVKSTYDTETEVKIFLEKMNKTILTNQKELLSAVKNSKQVTFVGDSSNDGGNHTTLEAINAVHGPSFGVGIICTCGLLFLISLFTNH